MAERVYLDCSSLPSQLRVNGDDIPNTIFIDGYEFLQRLEAIKDDYINNMAEVKPVWKSCKDIFPPADRKFLAYSKANDIMAVVWLDREYNQYFCAGETYCGTLENPRFTHFTELPELNREMLNEMS